MKTTGSSAGRTALYAVSGGALSAFFALAGAQQAEAAPQPPPPPAKKAEADKQVANRKAVDAGPSGRNEQTGKRERQTRAVKKAESDKKVAERKAVDAGPSGRNEQTGKRERQTQADKIRKAGDQARRDEAMRDLQRTAPGRADYAASQRGGAPGTGQARQLRDARERAEEARAAAARPAGSTRAWEIRQQQARAADAEVQRLDRRKPAGGAGPQGVPNRWQRAAEDTGRVANDALQKMREDYSHEVKGLLSAAATAGEAPGAIKEREAKTQRKLQGRVDPDLSKKVGFLRNMGKAGGIVGGTLGAIYDIREGKDPAQATVSSVLGTVAGGAFGGMVAGAVGGPPGIVAGLVGGAAAGLVTSGAVDATWEYFAGKEEK